VEAADEAYKRINRAYQILSDKSKRMGYDAVDTCTDHLPTEEEINEGGFFPVMSHYFEVNARWSTNPHVPGLGDENTTWAEVEKFYNFWENFQTWRDFTFQADEKLESAQNRWERRAMIKDHDKEIKMKRIEEANRIQSLVRMAKAHDPRIAERERMKKLEKERKKAMRQAMKLKEQPVNNQDTEKEKEEKEQLAEREEKVKAKQAYKENKFHARKARQAMRQISKEICDDGDVPGLNMEELLQDSDPNALRVLASDLGRILQGQEALLWQCKASGESLCLNRIRDPSCDDLLQNQERVKKEDLLDEDYCQLTGEGKDKKERCALALDVLKEAAKLLSEEKETMHRAAERASVLFNITPDTFVVNSST